MNGVKLHKTNLLIQTWCRQNRINWII